MAEKGHTTFARLVSMVRVIDDEPGITIGELATRFGLTRSRIKADIELLDRAGIGDLLPGNTFEIDYDLYTREGRLALQTPLQLAAPLPLSKSEFARLVTSLGALAPLLSDEQQKELPKTLSAVLAMSGGSHSRSGSEAEITTSISNPLRPRINLIQDSILSGRELSFDYVDGSGKRSHRTILSTELHMERDGWIVDGVCADSGSTRSFRLDRMSNVVSELSSTSANADLKAQSQSTQSPAPDEGTSAVLVDVVLDGTAGWIVEESSATEVRRADSGQIHATYRIWDESWFRTELLLLAPWVVETRPERYFEEVGKFAQRAIAIQSSVDYPTTSGEQD